MRWRLSVAVVVSLMVLMFGVAGVVARAAGQTGTSPAPWPAKSAMDRTMGDYEGTFQAAGAQATPAYGRIIAEWDDNYRVVLYPWVYPQEDKNAPRLTVVGKLKDGVLEFSGHASDAQGQPVGPLWTGKVKKGKLTATAEGGSKFSLTYLKRKSPTEGLKPPKGAVVLLASGKGVKPTFENFESAPWKVLADGIVETAKGDLVTKQKFGDCQIHVEFCIPYMPNKFWQERANSGVFLANRYELQVLDSFGLKSLNNDCAAIYSADEPLLNACYPPLSWQTYDIIFRTARFDANCDTSELPMVTVYQNGVPVQKGRWILNPTNGWLPGNTKRGQLRLQYHLNQVHYRNVWVLERNDIQYTPQAEMAKLELGEKAAPSDGPKKAGHKKSHKR